MQKEIQQSLEELFSHFGDSYSYTTYSNACVLTKLVGIFQKEDLPQSLQNAVNKLNAAIPQLRINGITTIYDRVMFSFSKTFSVGTGFS